ncbi:DUF3223 domain-containing protein [Thalassospira xianhensis]|nr:DUF3223 domain-containing protein [Thalassospira xianhensis]
MDIKKVSTSKEVHAILKIAYPHLFGERRVPLALGITAAIKSRHPELKSRPLRWFMHWWTSGISYHQGILEDGAVRTDLDGNTSGEVTDENRAHARERLEYISSRFSEAKEEDLKRKLRSNLPAQNEFQELSRVLHQSDPETPLSHDVSQVLLARLRHHPSAAAKIGCGVKSFVVDEKFLGKFKTFAVIRTDGTRDTFSIRRCYPRTAPHKQTK